MFLQTVANVFIYSLRTSYFYLCILILISIPEPFSSTQRTGFESLLFLLNSLAHWEHGGENDAAGSEAMSDAGCVLRYSPGQPPGQASQLVSRAIQACLCYSQPGGVLGEFLFWRTRDSRLLFSFILPYVWCIYPSWNGLFTYFFTVVYQNTKNIHIG